MAELEKRLDALETEMRLIKGEIKQALLDIRSVFMKLDSPATEITNLRASNAGHDQGQRLEVQSASKAEQVHSVPPAAQAAPPPQTGYPWAFPQGVPAGYAGVQGYPPGYAGVQGPPPGYAGVQGPPSMVHSGQAVPSFPSVERPVATEEAAAGPVRLRSSPAVSQERPVVSQEREEPLAAPTAAVPRSMPLDNGPRRGQPARPADLRQLPPTDRRYQKDPARRAPGFSVRETYRKEEGATLRPMDLEDIGPASVDVAGSIRNINLLSNLLYWCSLAKRRIGPDKLEMFLELYTRWGVPSLRLKETITFIASMVGDDNQGNGQSPQGQGSAQDWIDLMLQLHGILTGSDRVPYGEHLSQIPMDGQEDNGTAQDSER